MQKFAKFGRDCAKHLRLMSKLTILYCNLCKRRSKILKVETKTKILTDFLLFACRIPLEFYRIFKMFGLFEHLNVPRTFSFAVKF